MNDKNDEKEKRVLYIYKGRYLNSKKKLVYCYLDTSTDDDVLYKSSLIPVSIGNGIEVTKLDNGCKGPYEPVIISDGHPYVNRLDISKWRAKSEAEIALYYSYRDVKQLKDNFYDSSIQRLRDLYKNVHSSRRQALLFKIIYEITK